MHAKHFSSSSERDMKCGIKFTTYQKIRMDLNLPYLLFPVLLPFLPIQHWLGLTIMLPTRFLKTVGAA